MAKNFQKLFTHTLNRIAVIDQYVTSTPVFKKNLPFHIQEQKFAEFPFLHSLQFLDLTKDL